MLYSCKQIIIQTVIYIMKYDWLNGMKLQCKNICSLVQVWTEWMNVKPPLIGQNWNRMDQWNTTTFVMEHFIFVSNPIGGSETFHFCVKSYWWKQLLKENLQINILNERQYRVIIIWNTRLKPWSIQNHVFSLT